MNVSRRVALGFLFVAVGAEAARMSVRSSRSGSPAAPPPAAPLEDVPGPSGAASMTVNFAAVADADGIVLYYDTATNASVDPADWPYRKVQAGAGITSVTVTGVAVDNYFCKPAGYDGTVVGDLGQEIEVNAA
jgi:hypothetical protein